MRNRGVLPRTPSGVVARDRLQRRLDVDRRLTVVHGPPGSGKTTLLVQWLERRVDDGVPHVWLDLHATIDAVVAWDTVAEALEGLDRVPASLPRASGRERAEVAAARLSRPARLVVDGLDELPGVAEGLVEMAGRAPVLRLVLAGRSAPGGTASCLPETSTIGPRELRFTPSEQRTLVEMVLGADEDTIERLWELTRGWPALTRSALLALGEDGETRLDDAAASAERYVRDHQCLRMIASHGTDVERLAALETVTTDAAMAVATDHDVTGRLALLERIGLLDPVSEGGWQWPAAVRSVLHGQLRERDPDGARALHTRLARWFAERDQPGSAMDQARLGEAWDLVVQLLDQHFVELLVRDDEPLRAALAALPDDVLATRPVFRDAYHLIRDVPLRGATRPVLTLDPGPGRRDTTNEALRDELNYSMMRTTVLRLSGYAGPGAQLAAEMRAVIDALDDERRREVVSSPAVIHAQLGVTRLLGADLAGAEGEFRTGYDAATTDGDETFAFDNASHAAHVRALCGDLEGASRWLERATTHDATDTAAWLVPLIHTSGNVAAALVAADRLDRAGTEAALARANDPTSHDELWGPIAHAHTRHALLWGDRYEALARIDRARASHPGRYQQGSLAHLLLVNDTVDLLLALGQIVRARDLIAAEPSDHPIVRIRRARLALVEGRPDQAALTAAALLDDGALTDRERLDAALLRALAASESGDDVAARAALAVACRQAVATGARAPFVLLPVGGRECLSALAGDGPRPWEETSSDHPEEVFPLSSVGSLTRRERSVLVQLSTTGTLPEIADRLHVSHNTVKSQVRAVYRKLGVSDRRAAVAIAAELGLVAPEDEARRGSSDGPS